MYISRGGDLMEKLEIRKPAVAGSFYASDSKSLNMQIENCFLNKIGPGKIPKINPKRENNIIGLVSPHAGYMYSGPVAANGFYEIALDELTKLSPNTLKTMHIKGRYTYLKDKPFLLPIAWCDRIYNYSKQEPALK